MDASGRRPLPWRLAVSLLLGLGLVAWLLAQGQLVAGLSRLADVSPWVLALCVLAQLSSYLCRSARLSVEFGPRAPRRAGEGSAAIEYAPMLRIALLHNASVNLLPMRGGELALPWLLHRAAGVPVARGTATLVWLRVQDAVVLAVLALAGWPGIEPWLRGASMAALAGGIVLMAAITRRLEGDAAQVRTGWRRWAAALLAAMNARPATWAWSAANWVIKLAGIALLLAALLGLDAGTAWRGALAGELAALLPVQGTAGFGSYEAAVAFGLRGPQGLVGAALGAAFAAHCVLLVVAFAAAGAAWVWLPAPRNLTEVS
jgi:hypothetical protein